MKYVNIILKCVNIYVFFPVGTQSLLLTLCIGIIPGNAQRPYGVLGIKTSKLSVLPSVLSLQF